MNELANTLRMYAGSNHYDDKCADAMSQAADRLEDLEKERDKLILAVADHATARRELAKRIAELEKENAIEKANGNHWSDAYIKWATTDIAAIRLKELEQKNSDLEKESAELESEIRTLTRQNGEWREDRDQLASQNVAMREALNAVLDAVIALEVEQSDYLLRSSVVLKATDALALPDLASEVLKRRDAEVLRRAADRLQGEFYEHAAADVLRMVSITPDD